MTQFVPKAFFTGQVKIATGGTALPLAATGSLINGVIITADSSNTSPICIGTSTVTSTSDGTGNGALLYPGASLGLASNTLSDIYVNGATVGDFISYLAS